MSLASAQLEDLIGDSIGNTSILTSGGISSEYTGPSGGPYDLGDIGAGISSGHIYLSLGTDLLQGSTTGQTGGRWTSLVELDTSSGGYGRAYGDSVNPASGSAVGQIAFESTTAGTWQNTNAVSFPTSTGAWQDSNSNSSIIWAVIGFDNTSSNTNTGGGSANSGSLSIPLIACRLKDSLGADTSITVAASGTTVTFAAGELKFSIA